MKPLFILFITLSASSNVFSQAVAVAADKQNLLYAGVYNPLTIAVENIPKNSIVVKASRGTVTKNSDAHYTYKGNEPGEIDIVVYKKEKNKLIDWEEIFSG